MKTGQSYTWHNLFVLRLPAQSSVAPANLLDDLVLFSALEQLTLLMLELLAAGRCLSLQKALQDCVPQQLIPQAALMGNSSMDVYAAWHMTLQ